MLMFGLRLGTDPRAVVTATPKPIKIIRELIADPTTVITHGSTYDNQANLAPVFLQQIIRKYEGTRLDRPGKRAPQPPSEGQSLGSGPKWRVRCEHDFLDQASSWCPR